VTAARAVIAAVAWLGWAGAAAGFVAGAPGNSGSGAATCNDCHSGGVAPTVSITGADALAPGETGTYVIVVSSASPGFDKFAGIDVAASAGTLAAHPSQNTDKLAAGEVVQDKLAGPFATLQFQFDLTAPSSPGTVTLFGDGLSCDGNGGADGDAAATTRKMVLIQDVGDMAGQAPDLAGSDLTMVDATSGATPVADMAGAATHKDEPRWGCGCALGERAGPVRGGAALLALVALIGLARRRVAPRG
jgi:MYXO-CTERM domain-containing protein